MYDSDRAPLPDATWEKISTMTQKLQIPTTNLTPVFIREAKRYYFEENQFIYWKDDGHWNIKGISLTAQIMCQTVKELKCAYNKEEVPINLK